MKITMRIVLALTLSSSVQASFLGASSGKVQTEADPVISNPKVSAPQAVPQAAVAVASHQEPDHAAAAQASAAEARQHLQVAQQALNMTEANVKEIHATGTKIEDTAGRIKDLYGGSDSDKDKDGKDSKDKDKDSKDKDSKAKATPEGEAGGVQTGLSPDSKHSLSVWQEVVTWVVMIVASVYAHRTFRSEGWKPKHRAPYTGVLLVLWTVVLFTTIFFNIKTPDWSWAESLYFTIVTVTTVGYGDYVPQDSLGEKLILLFLLWFNMLILSCVMSLVVSTADDAAEGKKGEGIQWYVLRVLCLTIIGAILFAYLEGWTFLEGLTFATVTLSTVGYGALLPNSGPTALWCASVFILIGVPTTGCLVGKLSGMVDDKFSSKKKSMSNKALLGTYTALIIGWLLFGATGFHLCTSHGWSWFQCLYLSAVTMTTVGYGDLVPEKTAIDRVFTIFFIWGSVIVISAVFSDFDAALMADITSGMKRHAAHVTRFAMLIAIIIVGIVGMGYFEGLSFLDGLLYTSVSCTTVGYGHLLPTKPASQMFAVPFLLFSVPMTGCIVSSISDSYSDEIGQLVADVD